MTGTVRRSVARASILTPMSQASFRPFVPAMLTDRLVRAGVDRPGPDGWRSTGVVLVVDITGFTALTERLAARGPGGAETLAEVLNATFGDVIDRVHAHGGDVVSFAGDAIQALWSPPPTVPVPTGMRAAVLAAAACALETQATLSSRPPIEDVHVRARAGIAVGGVWIGVVGGVAEEWRWVVGGAPLGDAGMAAARARPGELVLTAEAMATSGLTGHPTDDGSDHALVGTADMPLPDHRAGAANGPPPDAAVEPEAPGEDLLAAFVPRELVRRVRAGQTGWLAEFRWLTVVFIGIRGFDDEAAGALLSAQAAFQAAQIIIDRYGGSLNQIVDDDKGITLVAGWGLPDRTHEDDAIRGATAAREIVDALTGLGLRASAGVGTGRAFTGIRGNAARCEYAMVGDVMNLAARLMQSSADEVRCDPLTARAAATRLTLVPVGSLALKGKAAAVRVARVESSPGPPPPTRTDRTGGRELVGRAREWATLTGCVTRLVADGRGGIVVIEGEPGVGKSELIAQLVAGSAAVRWHIGAADAIERSTAYFVWRRPLLDLLGVSGTDRPALEAEILAALADAPDLLDRASLLDAMLPIDIDASGRGLSLEADVRADAIRDLVVHLVTRAGRAGPRAIVLEDVHWMDSSSWALTLAVARRVPGVLLVLATRPMGDDAAVELGRLLAEPRTTVIPLGPLDAVDTAALVSRALGVSTVPTSVAAFIEERAEGNPFFSQQLALALRDAGHIVVEGDRCRLAEAVTDLHALGVPDSVRGVISGRLDHLSPPEQLTLKVASVIGRLFQVRVLTDVHPLVETSAALSDQLRHATSLDLTRLESPDPDLSYLFTHVITQEVAYDQLVFAQRRPLHRAVAEWYEAHVADVAPLLPLLAHHWSQAGVTDKALEYLGRAGEQALMNHANTEALFFLDRARALDDASGRPTPAASRADWERWTGIALVKSARYQDALPHFEGSLDLLGARNPRSQARRVLSISRHLGLQGWRRLRHRSVPAGERDRALAISECHRYLAEVSYWRNDLPRMVQAMLASLNHAEPAGDSKELVVALASVGFLCGLVQLPSVARYYRRLADASSDRVGNPDAAGYAAELETAYRQVVGDWAGVHVAAERGVVIFATIGDRMRWHTCFSMHGYADLHQGYFDRARPYWREGLRTLGPDGHLQGRLWSLAALLATDLAQDQVDPLVVAELEALLGPNVHHSDEILVRGLVATAHQRAGDEAAALAHALAVPPLVDRFPPPSWHTLLGIAGAAEVLLDRWAAAAGPDGRREARSQARHAISGFGRFARFNHAARPRVATLRGRAHWIDGETAAARRAWGDARSVAMRMDMPYESALADIELGASYPAGSAERSAALRRALPNLALGDAVRDAARAQALLVPGGTMDGVSGGGGGPD